MATDSQRVQTVAATLLDHRDTLIDEVDPKKVVEVVINVALECIRALKLNEGVPKGGPWIEVPRWHDHGDWRPGESLKHDHNGKAYLHEHDEDGDVVYTITYKSGGDDEETSIIIFNPDTEAWLERKGLTEEEAEDVEEEEVGV